MHHYRRTRDLSSSFGVGVITARGLRKTFGDRVAVDDLSFDVSPGRVTGFLGPNGAGKSTTLRLMLDLDRGEGTTLFDGVPYRRLRRPMTRVGVVLEAKSFHPTRSARNHLRMLAAASGIPASRADEVLAQVGLREVARAKPKGFSLGMGQRLGLAAALLGDPHTLVLDEPANGLDPRGIHWLRDFLQDFAAGGRTVFVSSHLLSEMALMADHLVVIGRGRLIDAGSVPEFVARFSRTVVVARSPQAGRLREVVAAEGAVVGDEPAGADTEGGGLMIEGLDRARGGDLAGAAGITLHELSTRTASLEQAFLEATEDAVEFTDQEADHA